MDIVDSDFVYALGGGLARWLFPGHPRSRLRTARSRTTRTSSSFAERVIPQMVHPRGRLQGAGL